MECKIAGLIRLKNGSQGGKRSPELESRDNAREKRLLPSESKKLAAEL